MSKKKWLALLLSAAMAVTLFEPSVVMASGSGNPADTDSLYSVDDRLSDDTETIDINDTYQADSISADDMGEDLPENDELFAGYVERLFYGDPSISLFGNQAAVKLDGINLAAYNALKDKIQKVASGELANTQFTLSMEDLGITKTEWTAEELGVNTITQDVLNNLASTITPDFSAIIKYLLVDCPLDLYWFDKTAETKIGSLGMSATSQKAVVTSGPKYYLAVASEYQDASAAESNYTVNTAMVQTAQEAVSNAKAIVKNMKI